MRKTYKRKSGEGEICLELTLNKDGDSFLLFDGSNLQEAQAVGVGKTKREAVFDYAYRNKNLITMLDSTLLLPLFGLKSIFS